MDSTPQQFEPATVMPGFQPVLGYVGDPFVNGAPNVNSHQYPPSQDYHMLYSSLSWPSSQFALASHYPSFGDGNMQQAPTHPNACAGYGNQYPYQYLPGHGGDRLGRLGLSATKEARKKRMARQRRFMSHHRNHSSHHQQQQHHNSHQNQNHGLEQHARIGNDNVAPVAAQPNPPNWVYWPPPAAAPVPSSTAPVMPMEPPPEANAVERPAMQNQNYQRQVGSSDRRQGWKSEKNLRFLLQKVLKQRDVGNLGRIMLPKNTFVRARGKRWDINSNGRYRNFSCMEHAL